MNEIKQDPKTPTERELLGHFIDLGLLNMSLQELRVDWMRLHLDNFQLNTKINQLIAKNKSDRTAGPAAKKKKGDEILFYLVSLAVVKDAEDEKITGKTLARFWDALILEILGEKGFAEDIDRPTVSRDRLAKALREFRKIKKNWVTASKTEFPEKD